MVFSFPGNLSSGCSLTGDPEVSIKMWKVFFSFEMEK